MKDKNDIIHNFISLRVLDENMEDYSKVAKDF